MLILAMLSSVAFAVVPPSNVARVHRPGAFATMIPTPTSQNAQPSPNAVFQCGGVDGEPFRDTISGGSSFRLRIFNDAPVDSDTLDRALKRVTAIYAQIRVRLRWTTTDPFTHDGMPLFDIVITNSARSKPKRHTQLRELLTASLVQHRSARTAPMRSMVASRMQLSPINCSSRTCSPMSSHTILGICCWHRQPIRYGAQCGLICRTGTKFPGRFHESRATEYGTEFLQV